MGSLFQTDGPLMRAMTDIMNLLILNIVTALCCLPIVTAGAALTSMHYVLMQMAEQSEGHIIGTFWKQFTLNLKSATPVWLLLLAAGILLYLDYRVFGESGNRLLLIPVYIGGALLAMLFVWIFPLMARFENRLGATLRNAALLAVGYLPRTIAMAAICAVVPFFLTQVTRLLPLAFFFGISFPSYLCGFLYGGVIREMVKKSLSGRQGGETREGSAEEEEAALSDCNTSFKEEES